MTEAIVSGILLGLALIFTVGPVIFTVIKLRINYSMSSAFYFISGVWLSDILWIITANHFSGIFGNLIDHKTEIGIAGGSLLLALSIYYLFFRKYKTKAELDQGIKIGKATHARLFITGFLMNSLNPGVIALWFVATTKSLANTPNEKIITFTICMGLCIAADIFKINLAGKLREKLNDRNIRRVNVAAGLLYCIFGLALIIAALVTYHPH